MPNKITTPVPPGDVVSIKSQKNKNTVDVPIDGLRVAIEIVVFCCHLISSFMICFSDTISTDVSWSLLALCITTFNTLIQFQNEARWKYQGNLAFNIPFWGIIVIVVMIFTGFLLEPFRIVTQHRIFVVSVSLLLVVRQFMHALLIYNIYRDKKGKDD